MAGLVSGSIDVTDRRETWLFSEIEQKDGKPVYRRLGFNEVQYGNDPETYLEPHGGGGMVDLIGSLGTQGAPITSLSGTGNNGMGRMVNIRLIKGRYSRVHAFDDYDAAASDCERTGI